MYLEDLLLWRERATVPSLWKWNYDFCLLVTGHAKGCSEHHIPSLCHLRNGTYISQGSQGKFSLSQGVESDLLGFIALACGI